MFNKTFLFVFLFFILLTGYSLNIPFFWDGTFFSEIACKLYDGTYNLFNLPSMPDNYTVVPVFRIYLLIVWKLFEKSLLVSHLAMLPFLLGISYEFYKLCRKFLNKTYVSFALLLLIAEPTFITQSILMSSDIILLYLFLLLLNLLLEERYRIYTFIVPFLALYSVRGIFLAFSLVVIQFVLNRQKNKHGSLLLLVKTNFLCLLVVCWFLFHRLRTDWIGSANPHEQLLPFSMMLRQIAFIIWKLADFGRVVLWLFFLTGLFFLYKRKNDSNDFKKLLLIIFIPVFVTAAFMVPFSNPVGHRYFMFSFLSLIIGACYVLQQIENKKIAYSLLLIFMGTSITGNYWIYPERFGNGWDSSLKVLPFFQLKEQMDQYVIQNKIDPKEVGTQFPLIADKRFSHLSDSSFQYTNVWRGPLSNYSFFLQTNVINTDIPEQIDDVKKNWRLVKTLKSGEVYLSLYKNNGKH